MTRKIVKTVGLIFVLLTTLACLVNHRNVICKKRGDAYSARVARLRWEAHAKLKIGTKKDAVLAFFAENSIPATFSPSEASGTIRTSGCAPSGCGSDAALLGLRVKVDEAGTVVSEPVIGAIYTDCL
jgi:hypothetical protein